jgi:anhydro-N-acetylmuramic acid kinase
MEHFIGLMSGTSMDGVDGVLADFSGGGVRVLATPALPSRNPCVPTDGAQQRRPNELHRAWLAGNALMRVYADVVRQLLATSGLGADRICAIGAHGQTVRHRPQQFDGTGYTIQLAQPALLAELTGIRVVADFRSPGRGGGRPGGAAGALLPPGAVRATRRNRRGAEHRRHLQPHPAARRRLHGRIRLRPGNALMDAWCLQHTGQPYDDDGRWAAGGPCAGPAVLPAGRALLPAAAAQEHRPRPVQPPWLDGHLARLGQPPRRTCRPR